MVGGLHVRPAEVQLNEWSAWSEHTRHPTIGRHTAKWRVVQVVGTERVFNWDHDSRRAAQKVGRLAGVLSVVTGWPFVVRQGPQLLTDGSEPPDITEIVRGGNEQQGLGMDTTLSGAPFEVPAWLDGAWEEMAARLWLARAVHMFQEGGALIDSHPSLAGVALIAVIEAVAGRLFIEEMCSCGQHYKVTERFRAAVRLVADPPTADLLGNAYKLRSKTDLAGQLSNP